MIAFRILSDTSFCMISSLEKQTISSWLPSEVWEHSGNLRWVEKSIVYLGDFLCSYLSFFVLYLSDQYKYSIAIGWLFCSCIFLKGKKRKKEKKKISESHFLIRQRALGLLKIVYLMWFYYYYYYFSRLIRVSWFEDSFWLLNKCCSLKLPRNNNSNKTI